MGKNRGGELVGHEKSKGECWGDQDRGRVPVWRRDLRGRGFGGWFFGRQKKEKTYPLLQPFGLCVGGGGRFGLDTPKDPH